MTIPLPPLKRVLYTKDTTTIYNRPGEGSRWHHLECGHVVVTKQSAGFQARKRCRECGRSSTSRATAT